MALWFVNARRGSGQYTSPHTNAGTVINSLPLPTIPAAGNVFNDPTFTNVRFKRITDANDGSVYGTAYAYWRSFNADGTRLLCLKSDGANYVFSIDLSTCFSNNTPLTRYSVPNSPAVWADAMMWDPSLPNIAWAFARATPRLYKFDFTDLNSITQTLEADFTSKTDGVSTILSNDKFAQASISDGGDYFGATWIDASENRDGYVILRRSTAALTKAILKPGGWTTIDEGIISRDASHAYVIDGNGINSLYYNISGGTTNEQPDGEPGHYDTFGTDGIVGWDNIADDMIVTSMSDPATRTVVLDASGDYGGGNNAVTLNHSSTRANDPTRFLASFYVRDDYTWKRLVGEVVRFKLDGSGVERLFHHHSMIYTGGDGYTPTPRANSYRTGSKEVVAFSSNMSQGLGSRVDLYLAECPL